MEDSKLQLLHEHYKDTCSVMASFRKTRDRYFYLSLAVLAVVLFDISTPENFGVILSEFVKNKLQITTAPDMSYVRSLIWVFLLGITIRYCQTALHIERQYKYIHDLEDQLATEFEGKAFTREGKAYLAGYPLFSSWAHYLYSLCFPLLLIAVVVVRTVHELRIGLPKTILSWFDLCVAVAICVTVTLHLIDFHHWPKRRARLKV
jgi:hypothetical protein